MTFLTEANNKGKFVLKVEQTWDLFNKPGPNSGLKNQILTSY